MENQLVLRGTTSYFELVEASKRMGKGELVFLITPIPVGCNYSCPKCFSGGSDIYNEQLRQRGVSTDFNTGLRKRMIEDCFCLGAQTLVIPGAGEPLMYPGLDEIVKYAAELKMHTVIFTNGFHLSATRAEQLFSNGASLIFSYDSTNPENYDKLTGTKGNHETARLNLERALALSEQHSKTIGRVKIVPFAVNTNPAILTFNPKAGIDEIKEISELLSGRAVHFVSHPTATGNAEQNWSLLTGRNNAAPSHLLRKAEAKYGKGFGGSSRRINGVCAYLHNGITVYEGYYMPCPNFGLKIDLGKYPDTSIQEHLNRKKGMLSEKGNPLCITRE